MVSEKEVQKELREHPWATVEIARRIAQDHAQKKTTTKEGKRAYQRDYMRMKRQQQRLQIPDLSQALGLQQQRKKK
jgi:hypothetical protein